MAFARKVFISYSHHDVDWAKALNDRLTQDGFSSFLDQESLHAGDDWEKELIKYLESSQHVVVLMSAKAKASDWVRKEYTRFDAMINPSKPTPEDANRRLIFILLNDDDTAFNRGHKITDFKTAKAYEKPVADVIGTTLWEGVITQVENALSADVNTVPVSLAVLALTRTDLDPLYDHNIQQFATKVNKALGAIGVDVSNPAAVEAFKDRYGEKASDWKPFGSGVKVSLLMDRVMTNLNKNVGEGKPFRWEPMGEKFYTGSQVEIRNELTRNNESPSVFVVDPISLYDANMVVKLDLLGELFENDRSIFLVMPPVIPHPYAELMELVQNSANTFFSYFYDSRLRRKYANCSANVCDERDIGRMLRATLGPHVYVSQQHVVETSVG